MADLDAVRWNDEARGKILADADGVLRDAVADVARDYDDGGWESAFQALHERLKRRFIDYEPGPDVRKFAEMIAAGEFD